MDDLNISPNIDSKDYLTSKGDTTSFKNKYNEKNFDNGTNFDFTKFTEKWSLIEFDSKKEAAIKILDNSKITEGKIYILVLNSNYKDILIHKLNRKSVLNFCTPKGGKYSIRTLPLLILPPSSKWEISSSYSKLHLNLRIT
ncbi:hypothetical protein [Clostridium kluyveri]|uniref:hypothetical protein n=1 Tax=Clostridium kluyveri TaxID=1534 RepID=UPI0022470A07|nr:hypothetical protein [Clostridium kluyveri]UZQ49026.1 hypothetical protein OP486_13720 [Clostridium kluyveri]